MPNELLPRQKRRHAPKRRVYPPRDGEEGGGWREGGRGFGKSRSSRSSVGALFPRLSHEKELVISHDFEPVASRNPTDTFFLGNNSTVTCTCSFEESSSGQKRMPPKEKSGNPHRGMGQSQYLIPGTIHHREKKTNKKKQGNIKIVYLCDV